MIVFASKALRHLAITAVLTALTACDDDAGVGPGAGSSTPDILLITSIADASGVEGSSFVQTVGLDQGAVTNANAFEQSFYPYSVIHGNDVIVTQHLYGDQVVRYIRDRKSVV